ncbi:MAG TPA: hypothetical protein VF600_01420 [Abditibacteriaceae bacterium]
MSTQSILQFTSTRQQAESTTPALRGIKKARLPHRTTFVRPVTREGLFYSTP